MLKYRTKVIEKYIKNKSVLDLGFLGENSRRKLFPRFAPQMFVVCKILK